MSKKPNIGGTVQISGKPYMVLSAPTRLGEWFSILVLQNETDPMQRAVSEAWRGGCGPWKLVSPADSKCPHVTPPKNLSQPCQICGALGPWFDSGDCAHSSIDRATPKPE
jgi:hypothetical protein